MDIYLVFGFISEDGSDEGHTYIYGVFDDRVVAEEKKNKLEEALERDGSDERIYIPVSSVKRIICPTRIFTTSLPKSRV